MDGNIHQGFWLGVAFFKGYNKSDGSEKDFPVKLAETFSNISPKEAKRLVRDVNEEVFGRENVVKAEDVSFAENVYERIHQHCILQMDRKFLWK